jgi:hypothetical protein
MAKRPKTSEREFKACWRKLSAADRRFISALILVNEAVQKGRLRYHELSPQRERSLRRADRDTLFSIIVECLGILTKAPAMKRVHTAHQRRKTRMNGTAPAAAQRRRSKRVRGR